RTPHMSYFSSFNYSDTPDVYTLSLHDALPISLPRDLHEAKLTRWQYGMPCPVGGHALLQVGMQFLTVGRFVHINKIDDHDSSHIDRKSTRLNSSHVKISYAVFCLKKKNQNKTAQTPTHEKDKTGGTDQIVVNNQGF